MLPTFREAVAERQRVRNYILKYFGVMSHAINIAKVFLLAAILQHIRDIVQEQIAFRNLLILHKIKNINLSLNSRLVIVIDSGVLISLFDLIFFI
jgi:hypothetical protein